MFVSHRVNGNRVGKKRGIRGFKSVRSNIYNNTTLSFPVGRFDYFS